jgi:hypothetical protein
MSEKRIMNVDSLDPKKDASPIGLSVVTSRKGPLRIHGRSVSPGMTIQLEQQTRLFITCTIKSVEHIDRVSVGESVIGLVCAESDLEEASLYLDLCPPRTVIHVLDIAQNAAQFAQMVH